jgi:hypothetical protein
MKGKDLPTVSRRGDERSFGDHVIGKGVMKSVCKLMVRRRGDEKFGVDHMISRSVEEVQWLGGWLEAKDMKPHIA